MREKEGGEKKIPPQLQRASTMGEIKLGSFVGGRGGIVSTMRATRERPGTQVRQGGQEGERREEETREEGRERKRGEGEGERERGGREGRREGGRERQWVLLLWIRDYMHTCSPLTFSSPPTSGIWPGGQGCLANTCDQPHPEN